jgi:hypothetical protein
MLKLNKYLIEASFGEDYNRLRSRYPGWGIELHRDGHIMTSNKLAEIFHYGLLWWYIYNTGQFLNISKINVKSISTYDIKIILEKLGISSDIVSKIRKNRKFKPDTTVYQCLCAYPEKDAIISYIQSYDSPCFNPEELFQQLIKEPVLTKFGVFYQRSKILLEKITPSESNVDTIYALDRLNLHALEIIYNWVVCASKSIEFKFESPLLQHLDTLCLPVDNFDTFTLPSELR